MEVCLLCLNMIEDKLDSMRINSEQWLELDIANKIEKYFWSLIAIQHNSWICLACWQQVNDFHKFYIRIEEVHMNICKIEVEDSKEHLISQTSNEYSKKDNMAYCFTEPEILIDQTQAHNETETDFDKISERINETDAGDIVKSEIYQAGQDPLEKSECFNIEKKKRKYFKEMGSEEEKSKEDKDAKYLRVKDLFFLDVNNSDILSDNDVNFLPNKDSSGNSESKGSKSNGKYRKSNGKYRINREENDKFIAQHFKHMNCIICQESFQNFSAMQKHFLQIHQQQGYVVCCSRKYFNRRNLVDHIHCHLNPNYFKCTKCDKVLSDRLRVRQHVTRAHGSEETAKKHSCDVCGKSYLHEHYLRRHKLTHMSEEEKKFPCEECGKSYGSSDILHRHIQAVHLKKFVKICYICGKTLSSSTELKIHMNKHEGIPQPTINCDVCGLRLTTERGLKRHKDSQHPVDGKKDHYCPICPRISPTIKALRKHINTMHKKGFEHKCTICQKEFRRAEVLREHMASHTGTSLYTCPWCPKTFNSNGNMHAHRKKVHPKEWQEAKLQKYSGNIKPSIVDNNN